MLCGNVITPPPFGDSAPALISRGDSHVFKGVAILLMIEFHAFYVTVLERIPLGSTVRQVLIDHTLFAKLCNLGNVCVPIFLFVTGLGLALSAKIPFAGTAKKSLFRFWKMYLPCVLIGGAALAFFPVEYPNGVEHSVGVKQIALAFMGRGGTVCGEWWYASLFLTAIIVYFPICRIAFAKFGGGVRNAVFCAGTLLLWLVAAWTVGGTLPYVHAAPAFVLGYLAGTLNFSSEAPIEFLRKFREKNFALRAAVAIAFLVASAAIAIFIPAPGLRRIATMPAILFATWALVPAGTLVGKVLAFFGKYSGWMWLNHSFFLYYYLRHELYSLGGDSALGSVCAVFFATTALSLIAAIATDFLFARVERLFQRRKADVI